MLGGRDGGVNPTLRVALDSTEGRARPQGGRIPFGVAALSLRGSHTFNRRANGDIAPALGGGRARPGGTACLGSGRALISEQVAV
jgi:hypothetical protein